MKTDALVKSQKKDFYEFINNNIYSIMFVSSLFILLNRVNAFDFGAA